MDDDISTLLPPLSDVYFQDSSALVSDDSDSAYPGIFARGSLKDLHRIADSASGSSENCEDFLDGADTAQLLQKWSFPKYIVDQISKINFRRETNKFFIEVEKFSLSRQC